MYLQNIIHNHEARALKHNRKTYKKNIISREEDETCDD